MSTFTREDLEALCKALQSDTTSGSAIVLSNSLFDLARQHNVIWPLMSTRRVETNDPLVGVLAAQTERLAQMLPSELSAVHAALSTVCNPVYLKGAAILVERDFEPQFWRYMGDFDMLVKPDHLVEAVNVMEALGYHPGTTALYLPRLNPHYPILLQQGKICGIEIHTRLLRDNIKNLLNPDGIRARAEQVETCQGKILIASIDDRLIHLIAHAQIGSHRYHRRQFLIRDALEFNYLLSRPGADFQSVKTAFHAAGYAVHFDSFVAMSKSLIPAKALTDVHLPPKAFKWAQQSSENILESKRQNRWIWKDWIRMGVSLLFSPAKWTSYARLMAQSQFLYQRMSKQLK